MPFQIIRNDITKVKADAIVNTANPHPIIGSGTDSAIHEAAGPELLSARKKIGDIPPGSAASTPAFNLAAKYVIHTVGPSWVDDMARLTAEVTHNHPEGIKGAEATASAIFMARTGCRKEEIREYIIREFGYDLSRTCDEIRPGYHHVESCQKTVPEAVTAFLEGRDFEDVIRTAVSLGGDSDTLACIAGSMAEAMYGVTDELMAECRKRLPEDMLEVLDRFHRIVAQKKDVIHRK